MAQALIRNDGQTGTYLLFVLGGQTFGIAVEDVQSVEVLTDLTSVPLSGDHIGGVSQIHGHIVTAIDMRAALQLHTRVTAASGISFMLENKGNQYCILIDELVGVFDLNYKNSDKVPETVDRQLRKISTNVLRHEGQIILTTTADSLMESVLTL
jgi:purine-binding chemotaxis protein CheW